VSKVTPLIAPPKSNEWETPPDLFQALDDEFRFQLDVAASAGNALYAQYFFEDMDGLRFDWHTRVRSVWCNPPYGMQIGKWVRKAFQESRSGVTVVMLIPARTDTRYWHDYVMRASEIRLIRGRLRFSGATINAPFPSAVVVFRPGDHAARLVAIEANGRSVEESPE
jgi:site-specific DNA-methyltransferase (adenine-specific)